MLESRLVAEGGARGSREYKRLVLPFWSSVCAWSFNCEHLDRSQAVKYRETNQPQSGSNSLMEDIQKLGVACNLE